MKYYVTLKNKTYEVEVVDGEATLLNEYESGEAPEIPASPAKTTAAPTVQSAAAGIPAAARRPEAVTPAPTAAPVSTPPVAGAVTSPMPGSILDIRVAEGQQVEAGGVLMILEAMKMENEIVAECSGTVQKILVTKGQTVQTGAPLAVIG